MFNVNLSSNGIYYLDDISNNHIFIKREDLLPFSFGGNKYRICLKYYEDMLKKKCNCMIAYGPPTSNLCRVISNICKCRNVPCHIISPDENETSSDSFNLFLSNLMGATIHTCHKNEVSNKIDDIMELCIAQGYKPYYVNGNSLGKGNEAVPTSAYYDVYLQEIRDYAMKHNIRKLFLACGYGMTLAGLLAGICNHNDDISIIGISTARERSTVLDSIMRYYYAFAYTQNITTIDPILKIDITDDYLCGGYGQYDERINATINEAIGRYGIAMDPVYVGKAFFGMKEYLRKKSITGENILFIHTGGTPLWFDHIAKTRNIYESDQ